ncbi:MAG TPA: TetR/AcrR family transcriptional regulator [Mycobacteriales bacterium]|nr:TetR/AcrR family transcriptional regulator [Mycobacteriales bacterium]
MPVTGSVDDCGTLRRMVETAGPSHRPARLVRSEQMRARLLAAARESFAAQGWSRARVEDICRTAGVGHGTFYGYYANKGAALESIVRAHAADLYTLLEAEWTSGDVRSDVERVIGGFVALSERDADVRDVWLAAAPADPTLARLVDEVRRQFVGRIAAHLLAAREAGHARGDLDVDVASSALAAMVEQTVALALRPDAELDRERLVSGLADLWVNAVYRM